MKAKEMCGHHKSNTHFLKQIKYGISAQLAIFSQLKTQNPTKVSRLILRW